MDWIVVAAGPWDKLFPRGLQRGMDGRIRVHPAYATAASYDLPKGVKAMIQGLSTGDFGLYSRKAKPRTARRPLTLLLPSR